jgi:Raf kinase inhibitor-like YbhB/YbcL family protein
MAWSNREVPMRIRSDSFEHRGVLAAEFALGAPDGFGGNRNPHLAWDDVPAGTRSFGLLWIATDAPTDPAPVGRADMEIPVEQPRAEFAHWARAVIAADVREIQAGSCSDGVTRGGKRNPPGPPGSRQGLNDYTGWFAGDDSGMRGDWYGYDGPYPPSNDLRTHRYFFRLFALDVERLDLPTPFTAGDVFHAMHGHVLAETAIFGTYSLHPRTTA